MYPQRTSFSAHGRRLLSENHGEWGRDLSLLGCSAGGHQPRSRGQPDPSAEQWGGVGSSLLPSRSRSDFMGASPLPGCRETAGLASETGVGTVPRERMC